MYLNRELINFIELFSTEITEFPLHCQLTVCRVCVLLYSRVNILNVRKMLAACIFDAYQKNSKINQQSENFCINIQASMLFLKILRAVNMLLTINLDRNFRLSFTKMSFVHHFHFEIFSEHKLEKLQFGSSSF